MSRLDFRRSQHLSSLSSVSRWQRDHEGSGASSVDRRDQSQRRCRLWVNNGHQGCVKQCPLYTGKRTLVERVGMSALCHKRTLAAQQKPLFDHLVGVGKQRRRHSKAQCLRSLEIDDELKSSGKLYRQIGRLSAFENLINQSGSAFVHISQVRLVAHKATSFNSAPLPKHSGQLIADRELCDLTVDDGKR